jgi:hypothetical protein
VHPPYPARVATDIVLITMSPKANVTRDIADLVPQFLRRRHIDIESLRVALRSADAPRLQALGERMRALGNPYGFPQITTLGRQIVEATVSGELELIGSLIIQYEEYLKTVQIVHVDVPAPTWQNILLVAPAALPDGV